MTQSALHGIRIVDLTRVLAGPYCTMMLGDYGAEIIKIEQVGTGDGTRQWGPPWQGDQSAYFLSVNRNKKSVTLNLKEAQGREIVRQLCDSADIVVENFKVGAMQAWGLGWETLHARNPRLIMCSITGYGQTGPARNQAGYDAMIQAQGGIMSITGEKEGAPAKVGVAIADITTGMFAANAILAALIFRQHSGEGQYIDLALFDSQLGWLANIAQNHFATDAVPQRYGNGHASIVPYQDFETADGSIMLAVGNDRQFEALCQAAQWHDLAADPRFKVNADRVANRDTLIQTLTTRFRQKPTAKWLALCQPLHIPCAPINDVATALADPQADARNMIQTVDHPTVGPLKQVGPVAKLSASPATIQSPPPTLGEHTDVVLQSLGYSAETIADLRKQNIV